MLRTTFVENFDNFTILDEQPYCTFVQDNNDEQHYLLSDHLCAEVQSFMESYSSSKFTQLPIYTSLRNELSKVYNPFLPELYTRIEKEFIFDNTKELEFDLYRRINVEDQYYAVHKHCPWIGMNVTIKYGLKLCGAFLQSSCLDFYENILHEKKFKSDWVKATRETIISAPLQRLVIDRFNLAHEDDLKMKEIIGLILNSAEYSGLLHYAISLKGSDELAKEKGDRFEAFLRQLKRTMSKCDFQQWLTVLNQFPEIFQQYFTPRPRTFFTAKAPEETKCYKKFEQLRVQVNLIKNNDRYLDILRPAMPKPH